MLLVYKRKGQVVRQIAGQEGLYRLDAVDRLFNTKIRIVEKALLPIRGVLDTPPLCGIVLRGLKAPRTGGSYVVEFSASDTVRVLAYIDPYGRIFSSSQIFTVPPACEPCVSFVRNTDQPARPAKVYGRVYVHSDGSKREVALYCCEHGRYTLFGSWYNFDRYAGSLSYEEAMARAYLALVHRPLLGAPQIPTRGVEHLLDELPSEHVLSGLYALVSHLETLKADSAYCLPALVHCLLSWLSAAGLDELKQRGVKNDALRLAYTVHYAQTYYLSARDENSKVGPRVIWSLEAALNRFLLLKETLAGRAAMANKGDCARAEELLIEKVAAQHPSLGELYDARAGTPHGEWEVRCVLASAIERLRLPIRIDIAFRVDMDTGTVAFDVVAPDASFMRLQIDDLHQAAVSNMCPQTENAQADEACDKEMSTMLNARARRYALHIGLLLAALAFEASSRVNRVDIVARPFFDDKEEVPASQNRDFPGSTELPAYVQVTFDRPAYNRYGHFEEARTSDPKPVYQACGAHFDVAEAEAFADIENAASSIARRGLPEVNTCALSEQAKRVLGAHTSDELRIDYDAPYRHLAEELADKVVRAESVSQAIHIVRAVQNEAMSVPDIRAVSSCTRLMASLTEGKIGLDDQNAVVGSYLGEDRCLVALGRAKAVAEHDAGEAVGILAKAASEASTLNGFVDGKATVYRAFDSYLARILYNRARCAKNGFPRGAVADAGKTVKLVPDAFYLCHLEIAHLSERSFERTDEALYFSRRAVEIAPATPAGYRQLGRIYMLVGDMDNAAGILQDALHICVQPIDVAMVYYQLAYVLWKMGRAQDGAICYLKSIAVSPIAAFQATSELRGLVEETRVEIPLRENINEELRRANIPVAPTAETLEAIDEGAVAATDAGLFPVARELLAARLRYRSDDALANVLRSLEA